MNGSVEPRRWALSRLCSRGAAPHLLCSNTIAGIFVFALSVSSSANAQTLSEQLQSLTQFGCPGLDIILDSNPNPEFGTNLGVLCQAIGGGGPSSGGGTASPSGGSAGGASAGGGGGAQSYAVRRRLKELREGGDDKKQSSVNQTASLAETSIAQESYSFSRLGVFISGDFENRDRDTTTFESGFDSSAWSLTFGVDYRLTDELTIGISPNIGQQSGDFTGGGDFDTDTYGVVAYASYYPAALPGYFADLVLGYARKSFEVDRFTNGAFNGNTIVGVSSSDTDGDELSSRLLVGKDFAVSRFTVGPRLGVNYVNTSIDETSETGTTGLELIYDERTVQSLQTTLGFQAAMAISTGFGAITPTVAAEWVHEFLSDQQSIDVRFAQDLRPAPLKFSFQNDEPDRDFFNVRLGVVAVLPKGIQVFAEGRAVLGHEFFDTYGGALGVRLEL